MPEEKMIIKKKRKDMMVIKYFPLELRMKLWKELMRFLHLRDEAEMN